MPPGVPVTMMSPADSVKASLSDTIKASTSKTMSVMAAFCTVRPFRRVVRCRPLQPGGRASEATKNGPNGPVPSKFFPTVHWVVLS